MLEPARLHQRPERGRCAEQGISGLAAWVAVQAEGNRNAGLFWAACRVLEADPAADLGPLAAAARQARLTGSEITRTLSSARRAVHAPSRAPGAQAEGQTS